MYTNKIHTCGGERISNRHAILYIYNILFIIYFRMYYNNTSKWSIDYYLNLTLKYFESVGGRGSGVVFLCSSRLQFLWHAHQRAFVVHAPQAAHVRLDVRFVFRHRRVQHWNAVQNDKTRSFSKFVIFSLTQMSAPAVSERPHGLRQHVHFLEVHQTVHVRAVAVVSEFHVCETIKKKKHSFKYVIT